MDAAGYLSPSFGFGGLAPSKKTDPVSDFAMTPIRGMSMRDVPKMLGHGEKLLDGGPNLKSGPQKTVANEPFI